MRSGPTRFMGGGCKEKFIAVLLFIKSSPSDSGRSRCPSLGARLIAIVIEVLLFKLRAPTKERKKERNEVIFV